MSSIWHHRTITRQIEPQRAEGAPARRAGACRLGGSGATGVLVGVLLSGPVAVGLVNVTHPQPPWQGARTFAQAYHPVQLLPYLGGIVLVVALVMLMAGVHEIASEYHRARTGAALVFTSAFAALICFNYVVQTTFLPHLAWHYDADMASMVAAFSMSNPKSLAWGIEMWGWGLFGAATLLVAPVFRATAIERATASCFAVNGPVSFAGALLTVVRPGWVMTPAGGVAFVVWNVLLSAMAALAWFAFRQRGQLPRFRRALVQ
jgi:hypothetical protein